MTPLASKYHKLSAARDIQQKLCNTIATTRTSTTTATTTTNINRKNRKQQQK